AQAPEYKPSLLPVRIAVRCDVLPEKLARALSMPSGTTAISRRDGRDPTFGDRNADGYRSRTGCTLGGPCPSTTRGRRCQYAKGGTFYWHVAAMDSDGDTGNFGRAQVFRLAAGGYY